MLVITVLGSEERRGLAGDMTVMTGELAGVMMMGRGAARGAALMPVSLWRGAGAMGANPDPCEGEQGRETGTEGITWAGG